MKKNADSRIMPASVPMMSPSISPRMRDFVSIGVRSEKKGGGVSLSYPRYGGSRELEEPLACEFALWHLEVDVEAAVDRE